MLTKNASKGLSSARVKLRTIETRDVNFATEQMAALYGQSVRVDYFGKRADFATRVQVASFAEVTLAKFDNTSWSLSRETRASISLTVPLVGTLHYRSGSRAYDHEPSRDMAVGRPFETTYACVEHCEALNLVFPVAGILERAENLTGEPYNDSLISSMVDRIDAAAPVAKALARSMKAAITEMSSLNFLGMAALAAIGYEDLLLNFAVATLFPSVASSMAVEPAKGGPAVIRRARDYIQAHAAKPIDLSRLAGEIGISMRALQENFRRYYGCSPRAYVLECRLESARQTLLMPGRAKSVTNVALDSGFGDLSHFSAKYRDKFGESPSETLRGARREFS